MRQARVLLGAIAGCSTGVSALLLYTNGLFVDGLSREFGLTRTEYGFGVLLATMALAVGNPLAGWAVDRFGVKPPAVLGLTLLAVSFAGMGVFVSSTATYVALQALLAFLAVASGPVAFAKLVGGSFTRHRGIALGITMAGIGLAAAIVPPLLSSLIAERGWRAGYFALAVVPLVGALAVAFLVPNGSLAAARPTPAQGAGSARNTDDRWLRSRAFWFMAAASAAMSLAFMGLLPHFVPMLMDGGLDAVTAGGVAGIIGLAVISSRLLIGYLLDRLFAPRVAIGVCLMAAAGCVLFLTQGASAAPLTAIALGFAVGAELDLLGFLVARYFELAQFGRVYGWQYAVFVFSSGVGPLWVGAVRDATGNYDLTLTLSSAGLLAACVMFLLLPRYPDTAAPARLVSSSTSA
ncbi:MAG TPA: MFS transporter [Gammaproteobacteria bacterium]